ncbi:hypothetical protein PoB_003420100 [Plakobranchus ocellatus]|uniref:Uncharacterized protein n=1 Tax=Plakobranchus ocellatus TaxID=259542 RepID=A0AAV4AM93_9GAST|nr:hypothetical protein PoB_003420100 [Plakobranchus ocellatus]
MANIESKKCETHKESSLSKRKLSVKAVKKIMDTFSAFLNPFITERKHLACISSGQKVPEDIADDLLKVEDAGKKSFKEFVATRLKDKTTRFHKPLTKTKLKTVGSVSKSTQIKSAKNVVKIKAERNIFGQLLVLSQEYQIDMKKVLKYPLSPVPWSLSSPGGLPLKTNKATLLHKLENTFNCFGLKIFQDNLTQLTSSMEMPYSIVCQVVLIHLRTWQSKHSAVYLRPHLSTL